MSKSSKRLCIQQGAGHNFHITHKINISRRYPISPPGSAPAPATLICVEQPRPDHQAIYVPRSNVFTATFKQAQTTYTDEVVASLCHMQKVY